MGLLKRPATQDELLSNERQSEVPAEGQRTKIADLGDSRNPLGAAGGIVMAAVLGSIIWAVILLGLL